MLRQIKSPKSKVQSPKSNILFSIISGVGIGLVFIFPKVSFLAWVSLVPLFFILNKKKSAEGFLSFFLFGLIYYGISLYWVTYVSILGFILLIVYLSLFYLVFYLLGSFFIKRPLRQLTIPAVWVVVEFLKEIIWCGFSWASLGYSQFNHPHLIQIADIGGVKFISFAIVLVNFLIWELITYKKILKRLIFLLLIFAAIITYSSIRLNENKPKEKIDISLIQPNILDKQTLGPEEKEKNLKSLAALAKRTPENNLVIFPEAAWPYVLDKENTQPINEFVKDSKRNILIGAITKESSNYYNSALLFDRGGSLVKIYDKIKLVPFGEYVPLRDYLEFIEVLNSIGDITPGKKIRSFSYQDKNFAVLICFEDIFPYYVAEIAENKDFLLNITDDSWFHGQPEASQHLSIMVLRAVENRISIARAANSGISGWVSPEGYITKLKKNEDSLFIKAQEDFQISVSKKSSFYNRKKGWFVLVSFVFLMVIFIKKKVD
ncbi:MAG: apolipoprotein N-acyltransferase [Candidatus Omnitrophota bacterium]